MEEEIWKEVPSVPGLMASSLGRIMSKSRAGLMPHGGSRVYHGKAWDGAWTGTRYIFRLRGKTYKVSRVVCEAFHGPAPDGKPVCIHIDEDAKNNKPSNLKWGTQKENLNAPGFLDKCRNRIGDENGVSIRQRMKDSVPPSTKIHIDVDVGKLKHIKEKPNRFEYLIRKYIETLDDDARQVLEKRYGIMAKTTDSSLA